MRANGLSISSRTRLEQWVSHYNQGRPHASLGPGIPEPDRAFLMTGSQYGHQLVQNCKVAGRFSSDCITSTAAKERRVKDKLLRRRRPLITSPLEWQMMAAPVLHPVIPVLAERGGTRLQTPRPTVLVDTREQNPLNLSRFSGWFAGIEKKALKLGDYSIAGLEDVCVVERKDLSDLVHSCTADRTAFINRLRLMARYPHRLLVITSTLSQIKSPYAHARVDPNRITQFLVATLAGLQVPFVCSETHELGEELVGSYLYQVHLYHWLESNDHGRFLADDDI